MEQIDLIPLSDEELNLIKLIRTLQYGSLEVTIINGKPTTAKNVMQSIKL